LLLLFLVSTPYAAAQLSQNALSSSLNHIGRSGSLAPFGADTTTSVTGVQTQAYPDPTSVMYKSMIIPGWGQIQNKQFWKVPIIYGLLGGLTWYSIHLTKSYHDYRAAYYNMNPDSPDDFRFGPTPDYIPENASLVALQDTRNALRNQRDFMYIAIGLAYGLNIVDAYVFAHMRSFDVSEDLTMKTSITPSVLAYGNPGVTLSIELFNKKNR
jgi:hypothetical protein